VKHTFTTTRYYGNEIYIYVLINKYYVKWSENGFKVTYMLLCFQGKHVNRIVLFNKAIVVNSHFHVYLCKSCL